MGTFNYLAMTFIDKELEKRLLEYYRNVKREERKVIGFTHRPKPVHADPVQVNDYIKMRTAEEKKLPESGNIRLVIDQFCIWLYRNKYEYKHMPKARKISFKPKSGEFVYLNYNSQGWFHYGAFVGGFSIDFCAENIDDLLNKLLRYRLIDRIS